MSDHEKRTFPPVPPQLLEHARQLRQHMTDTEQLLWFCLRRKQLGGYRFRRQHPLQEYILDFYCFEVHLSVELDGGQHNEESGFRRDARRTAFIEKQGIKVVRVWDDEVFRNLEGVLQFIYDALLERTNLGARGFPLPNPPPPGEGTRTSGCE